MNPCEREIERGSRWREETVVFDRNLSDEDESSSGGFAVPEPVGLGGRDWKNRQRFFNSGS